MEENRVLQEQIGNRRMLRWKGTRRFLTCGCHCQLSKAMNSAVKFGFWRLLYDEQW
jgi:hypothetical protein